VLINWHGEVLKFYTVAKGEDKALNNAIRQLAKRIRRTVRSVRNYVLDGQHRRWEVSE
jgi:hypothetical protein